MSASKRGLRTRIIWTTALVAALGMAAMIGTVVLVLNAVIQNDVDSKLDDRLSLISAAVASDPDRPTTALRVPDDSVDSSTWLYAADGTLLEGPKAGAAVQAVADGLAAVSVRTEITRNERVYLAGPLTVRGETSPRGVLVVSESLEPYESTRTEVLFVLVALGLAVTGGATAIAAWTMARTLAPVVSMAEQAEDWSEHELDTRFDGPDVQNEIGHLGRTLNVLLDRVAGALRSEQRLTAELAHELRTPLSGVRGEAELAVAETTDPVLRERLERMISSADQMGTTITTLLAIARGERGPGHGTDVAEVVRAALHGRSTDGAAISIQVPGGLVVTGSVETVSRALSPLLDNAIRYAQSVVTVSARRAGRNARIDVSDDGPGLGPSVDPDAVFEPGTRDSASAGAGLGLALARRVARTLGGDVTVESQRHPTTFVLSLPLR
ncbi:MAG: ATP-binding protein [Propionibacteriales bacterium]|nr:ATP-binding protein [Propionibacteriales bacterium]